MKYALYPNKLTTGKPNTYIAKVQTNPSIYLEVGIHLNAENKVEFEKP